MVIDVIVGENCSPRLVILFEHFFHDALEQGDVAVDTDRQGEGGHFGAGAEHVKGFLRVFEANQPGFEERVDGDDFAAVAHGFLQFGEHARVAGAGILPDHENGIGMGEIVDSDRGFSEADDFGKAGAAGFMAHVGAIGEVVGAELSNPKRP